MHYQIEPIAAYIKCAPKAMRSIVYGIAETETARTGDPLQIVDCVTLRVYRPANPGAALAIIRTLEREGHPVAVGAFGLKSTNFKAWHITPINALNACFSANFASKLPQKNEQWAWGSGYRGYMTQKMALAAYTTGRLTLNSGGAAYVNTVYYFSNQYGA